MITLSTLKDATEQEVFYQVKDHLLRQKARSLGKDKLCKYRGENGLKCAAGCLIADEEYKPTFERKTWGELSKSRTYKIGNCHAELINRLQHIHDSGFLYDWEEELGQAAKEFGLKP